MPEKFEKRENKFKPIIYWVLTAVCVLLVIFPEWLPFIPSWLIRVVGVVGAIYLGLTALVADLSIYNRESGGEVKRYKTKKFISSMTDKEDIVDAFNRHDFEYLCDLPSGNDQPVQLQVEKDETGHEFYCILVTYTPGYKIVGLADPIILTGDEYEKNKRAKEPLHRQFIEQERAQIAWLRGESVELVCEHLETAILQTMPEAENQRKTGVLSAEEYKLLLFRWEVCQETEQKRAKDEIKALVEEIFRKNFEKTERVKIIPYAALLISKVIEEGENTTYIKMRTEEALEALRDEGKLLYMPEILSQYIRILEKEQSNADFIEILRQEQNAY